MIVRNDIKPRPDTTDLQKQIDANTQALADLRQQAEQYAQDHPQKAPCPHCKPTVIHIKQENLIQNAPDDTPPTYYADFSAPQDSIDGRLIGIFTAEGLMLPTLSATLLTPTSYIIQQRGIDTTIEGNDIYRITVCAAGKNSQTQTDLETSELIVTDTYYPPEKIDIALCDCGEDTQTRILTQQPIIHLTD